MPLPPPRDVVRMRHMLEAASKAVAYTDGYERSVLDTDEMRALAVVRLLEILGGAARAVAGTTPVLPACLVEPLWVQFSALLPEVPVVAPSHPWAATAGGSRIG